MPKPKAPEWLRLSFRDGIDFRVSEEHEFPDGYYGCQLAQHDPLQRPCSGRLERFHWVNRQRIENAIAALMPTTWDAVEDVIRYRSAESYRDAALPEYYDPALWAPELILIAAWDPRVGGIACEAHHRRFDSALTPPLVVPYDALPSHVTDWAEEKGLESQLEARCPRQVEPATKGGRQ